MKASEPQGWLHVMAAAWWNLHLSTQLFIALVLINGPVFLIFHAYDTRSTRRQIAALERSTAEAMRGLVASTVEQSMVGERTDHIDTIFKTLHKSGAVGYVQLLDEEKRVVNTADLQKDRPVRREAVAISEEIRATMQEIALVSKPECVRCHGSKKRVLGYVRMSSPNLPVTDAIKRLYLARAGMFMFGMIFLGATVLLITRRMVRRPMRRLTAAMDEVRRGGFQTRIKSGRSSEFNRIAEGFNSMVAKIAADRKEILDLHRRQMAHMERLVTLGELAANLAHEVRNPLTGIGGAIQVIMSEYSEENPRREVLVKILGQLDRMDKTMSSYLRYARMPDAVVRPFRIHEPLNRVLPIIGSRLRAQGITLKADVPTDLPRVKGDCGQMEQAFLNICLNAAQAMPQGGTLAIRAKLGGTGEISVEFSDTGSGISPEELDKIFKPFYTTRADGSGLGLPISKQIVMSHGGDITIESVLEKGTSVFVKLPTEARSVEEESES